MSNQNSQGTADDQQLSQNRPEQSPVTTQDSNDPLQALEALIEQSQERAANQPLVEDSASKSQTELATDKADLNEVDPEEANRIAALREQKELEAKELIEQHKQAMQAVVEQSPQTMERIKSQQEQEKQGDPDSFQTGIRQLSHKTIKTVVKPVNKT